jgi:ATP-dependent Clp endopeptidase proteolytic subunit ClpP
MLDQIKKGLIFSGAKSKNESEGNNSKTSGPPTMFPALPQILEVAANRIFFYADISQESVLRLNKTLMELDAMHISQKLIHNDTDYRTVYLYVNSMGGSLFDAFSAMDQLGELKSPVITVVDGVAASAATFLTLAGGKRQIKRHSFMLIHQLQSAMWGTYQNFQDNQTNLDMLMDTLRQLYLKHTKLPKKKLDEILKHDIFLTAKECLDYEFVDEII